MGGSTLRQVSEERGDAGPDGETRAVEASEEADVSRDDLFEILSNRRRRHVLHVLEHTDEGRAELSTVAEQVAAWEHETTPETLTYDQRRSVRTALLQHHAPKMDDAGVIEFDARGKTLELTGAAEEFDVYLEATTDELPWGVYFPALTAVCAVVAGAGWLGSVGSAGVWTPFVLSVFGVSSLAFLYDTRYRMRVGSGETPPEVDLDEQT